MVHRKQASHHAQRANQARANAQSINKQKKNAEASLQHYRDFGRKYPIVLFTILYILILLVDTSISYPLIRPIADRMLQGLVLIGFFFYGGLLLGLSTIASSNLFKAKREQIELQEQLELVHNPEEGVLSIRNRVTSEANQSKKAGVFWTVLLIAVLTGFGIFRTYIVNGHQLTFSNGADYIWLILPPVFGLLLVYLGQYKGIFFEKIRMSRFVKRADSKIDTNRSQAGEAKDMVFESLRKADEAGESEIHDKGILECIEFYKHHTASDPEFLSLDKPFELPVHIYYKGKKQAGIPVSAITMDQQALKVITDSTGCAVLKWKSESDRLSNLSVFELHVRGEKFAAYIPLDVELQVVLHQHGYDQVDFEKRLPSLGSTGDDPLLLS